MRDGVERGRPVPTTQILIGYRAKKVDYFIENRNAGGKGDQDGRQYQYKRTQVHPEFSGPERFFFFVGGNVFSTSKVYPGAQADKEQDKGDQLPLHTARCKCVRRTFRGQSTPGEEGRIQHHDKRQRV